MQDMIRSKHETIAKLIFSDKHEPYLEVVLYNVNSSKWDDPEVVLIYEYYTSDDIYTSENIPNKLMTEYEKRIVYVYAYKGFRIKQNKNIDSLKEHRSHNTCPACSSAFCTSRFKSNYGKNLNEEVLLCTCERCQYKWISKPNFLR